jgi:hypothetical protein
MPIRENRRNTSKGIDVEDVDLTQFAQADVRAFLFPQSESARFTSTLEENNGVTSIPAF